MKLEDYMTLKEIEESYGVKAETIRNYIRRNQVIPKEKLFKLGRQWLIDRGFAKEKWGNKEVDPAKRNAEMIVNILDWDGKRENLIDLSKEVNPVGNNSYLMQYDDKTFYIISCYNNVFANTGRVVFSNNLESSQDYIEQCAEKNSSDSLCARIEEQIEKNREIDLMDIELLKRYGLSDLCDRAVQYMQPKIEKQKEIDKKNREIRQKQQMIEEEKLRKRREEKIANQWEYSRYIMEYTTSVVNDPESKIYNNIVDSGSEFCHPTETEGKYLKHFDFYNFVENYIKSISFAQKGNAYRMILDVNDRNYYFKVNEDQYKYIQWRLEQYKNKK